MPAFAENFFEKRPVVGTIGAAGFEGDLFLVAMETSCQLGESEFGGHEHTVQLLDKRDDTAQMSTVFEIDGTKTESWQQGNFWGCLQWPKCNGTRRPWEKGKDEISPA